MSATISPSGARRWQTSALEVHGRGHPAPLPAGQLQVTYSFIGFQ